MPPRAQQQLLGAGVGSAAPGGPFSPLSLPQTLWWWDPYNPATIDLRPVATTSAGGNYLVRGDAGAGDPFNFQGDGTTTIFNISFWFYLDGAPANDDSLVSRNELINASLNNGVWHIKMGGVSNARIRLNVWTTATVTGLRTIDYIISGGVPLNRWNHLVMVYNGANVGDDTAVLRTWLNGAELATPAGSVLPQKFQNPSAGNTSLAVGKNFSLNSTNARFADLVMDASRVWTPGDAAALWNNRLGITGTADLAAAGFTNLTAYWPLTETTSSTRADESGNGRNLSVVGTVPATLHVKGHTDSKSAKYAYPYNLGANTTQGGRLGEPVYGATIRDGKPGIKFSPWNFFYAGGSFANPAGHIFTKLILDYPDVSPPTSELLLLLYADDVTDNAFRYLGIILQTGSSAPNANALGNGAIDLACRQRNGSNPNGDFNNLNGPAQGGGAIPNGNKGIPLRTDCYMEVACLDDGTTATGGASGNPNGPYRLMIDGDQQATFLTDAGGGLQGNCWCDNITSLTNFTINGLARLGPVTPGTWQVDQGGQVTFGDIIVTNAALSPSERDAVAAFLAGR